MEVPAKILVVDDELQIQLLLEEFLTSLGHTVRVAGDGEQALQLLRREAFDGVLADLKMANLGGMELLRRIKLSHPTLPIIMITGYPTVEVAVEAMKAGAVDIITKPLRLDTVRLALARIAGNRSSRQSIITQPSVVAISGPPPLSTLPGKIKELSILYTISEAFETITETEAIFQRLAHVACEIVGAQCSSFSILNYESDSIRSKTLKVGDEDYLLEVRSTMDVRTLNRLTKERQPLLFNDEQPGIVIPVFIKNELLGILSTGHQEKISKFA